MLKYGRDDETQADGLGFRYMLKESWDPREAVKMFQMLAKTSGSGKEGAPLNGCRRTRIRGIGRCARRRA
jgi:predicted Zn-dependent protease